MSPFPSRLIIASSSESAYKKAVQLFSELNHLPDNNPDLFTLNEYTISAVRSLKKFLFQKPFNHQSKIVFIPDADNLNLESQNTLLKTLEEPGNNNYLILSTTKVTKLLPTVLSRCQKIKIIPDHQQKDTKLWPLTGSAKKNLAFASQITSDKNEIKTLLQAQLEGYQKLLANSPKKSFADTIKKLIYAIDLIDNNVDPKSALDYFFLA